MKSIILSILFSSVFLTCSSTKNQGTDSGTAEKSVSDLNGKYLVKELDGKDVSEHNITIEFNKETKTISGYSGCNTYSCAYKVEQNSISIDFPMATKRYCPETGDLEKNFFSALTSSAEASQKSKELIMKGKEGKVLMTASSD